MSTSIHKHTCWQFDLNFLGRLILKTGEIKRQEGGTGEGEGYVLKTQTVSQATILDVFFYCSSVAGPSGSCFLASVFMMVVLLLAGAPSILRKAGCTKSFFQEAIFLKALSPCLGSLHIDDDGILDSGCDLSDAAHRHAITVHFLETGEEAPLDRETQRESVKSLSS